MHCTIIRLAHMNMILNLFCVSYVAQTPDVFSFGSIQPHSHSTCQNKNLFIKENTALVKNNLNVNSFQENHFVFFTVMTCAVKGELADHEVASTLPHPQSSLCMCVRDYEIETGIQRKRGVSSMCACIKSCIQVCVYVVLLNFFLL